MKKKLMLEMFTTNLLPFIGRRNPAKRNRAKIHEGLSFTFMWFLPEKVLKKLYFQNENKSR